MTSTPPGSDSKPAPTPRRRWPYVVLSVLVLGVIGAGLATGALYARLVEPYKGYEQAERFVEIGPGLSVPAIADRLLAAGVIRDRASFQLALWQTGQSRALKAGEYRFDRPMRAVEVVEKLARGDVYLRAITFPEGLSIGEMAELFERQGFGEASAFVAAAGQGKLMADLDPDAHDLEGYLFPDTYRFPRRATAADVVGAMVNGFKRVFDPKLRAETQSRKMTVRHLIALASIVEKETGRPEERPLVAAVYGNRLRIGMPLQCDPTVIYALQRAGRYTGNLTRADLAFDSPYNTYKYPGLPPGPIAASGKASIEAALRPADVPYLYFVSRNDGSHVYAKTLEEHNRNVQQYQVQYFRERRP